MTITSRKGIEAKKTIYGLIQAPLAFYQLCSKVYPNVGYTQLKSDECVFIRKENNVKEGSKSAKNRKPISTQICQLFLNRIEFTKTVFMSLQLFLF
jgi:hypothetical protein